MTVFFCCEAVCFCGLMTNSFSVRTKSPRNQEQVYRGPGQSCSSNRPPFSGGFLKLRLLFEYTASDPQIETFCRNKTLDFSFIRNSSGWNWVWKKPGRACRTGVCRWTSRWSRWQAAQVCRRPPGPTGNPSLGPARPVPASFLHLLQAAAIKGGGPGPGASQQDRTPRAHRSPLVQWF